MLPPNHQPNRGEDIGMVNHDAHGIMTPSFQRVWKCAEVHCGHRKSYRSHAQDLQGCFFFNFAMTSMWDTWISATPLRLHGLKKGLADWLKNLQESLTHSKSGGFRPRNDEDNSGSTYSDVGLDQELPSKCVNVVIKAKTSRTIQNDMASHYLTTTSPSGSQFQLHLRWSEWTMQKSTGRRLLNKSGCD